MKIQNLPEIEIDTSVGAVLLYVDADVSPEHIPGRSGTGTNVHIRDVFHKYGTPVSEEFFAEFEEQILDRYLREIGVK